MLSFDQLALEFPEQIWLEISAEDEEKALPTQKNYSSEKTRFNAYLNCLCLNLLLAWFQEEEETKPPLPFPDRKELPSVWEFINGSAIDFGKARFVIIPSDSINTEKFIIPAEWVDLPSWRGHYYLAIQINCEDGWLRVLGYATHKQIKNEAIYDEVNRNYVLDREDLVENLSVIFVMEDLDENELENNVDVLENLPSFSSIILTNLSKNLSKNQINSPRLAIKNFQHWKCLIEDDHLRRKLYELKLNNAQTDNLSNKIIKFPQRAKFTDGLIAAFFIAVIFAWTNTIIFSKITKTEPKVTFSCLINEDNLPIITAQTDRKTIPLISWTTNFTSDTGYTAQKRCEEVSSKFQKYYNQGLLNYITTGTKNNQNIICVSSILGNGCLNDDTQGQLLTLKPDDKVSTIIPDLLNNVYKSSGAIPQSHQGEGGFIERENGQDYWNINQYLVEQENQDF